MFVPSFVLALTVFLSGTFTASALTYEAVYKFPAMPRSPMGPLTKGKDGYFYGVTRYGGTNDIGAVYKLSPGGSFQHLLSFDSARMGTPQEKLLEGPGGMYASTREGGTNGIGTVYRFSTNGVLKVLRPFPLTTGKPGAPEGLVRGADGNFYGMLHDDDFHGWFFRMNTNGVTTMLSQSAIQEYMLGISLVQGRDGNFYGTCANGISSQGFIFKITTAGTFTKLFVFDGNNGGGPQGPLLEMTNGVFFGITFQGGSNGLGTIFKITSEGVLTSEHSFLGGTDGYYPYAPLTRSGDTIYGVSQVTVFKLDSNEQFSVVTTVDSANFAGVTIGDDGNLYCPSALGGADNAGAVFKVTPAGDVTTFYSFAASSGARPLESLKLMDDGSLFGTTAKGGLAELGTLFSMSPDGVFTNRHSFSSNLGYSPKALSKTADGQLYLSSPFGGDNGEGGIYSVTANGDTTLLTTFIGADDGSNLNGALTEGNDGRLYGTASGGGGGSGTVFAITTNGNLTVLNKLGGTNGANPVGPLTLGGDGNFYGVTIAGGSANFGTVFRVAPSGDLTTLLSFTKVNGATPIAGLAAGQDGNFYGTTSVGGKYNAGTVFRVTTNGVLSTLLHFAKTNGATPGQLIQGTSGKLYGPTLGGGKFKLGTIFQITTNGLLTTICHLSGTNGAVPIAALTEMPDGTFYGATAQGGNGAGVIYRLVKVPPTIAVQPLSRTNALRSTAAFSVKASGPSPYTYQWFKNGTAIPAATRAVLSVANLQYASGGNYSVIVSNVDGFTTSSNALLTIAPPPLIVSQPEDQTATVGTTAHFNVAATSLLPLRYQWQFKGVSIAGKTSATLALTNVQPTKAGVYRVIVSNGSGSITSSNALLSIQTCSFTLSTNIVYFGSTAASGSVSVTPNLGDCTWLTANTNSWISLTSGTVNSGNGNVTFNVAANTNNASRVGTIFTAGTNFIVVQAGTLAPGTITGKTFAFTVTNGVGSNFRLVTSLIGSNFIRLPATSAPANYTYQRSGATTSSLTLAQAGFYQLTYTSPYTGTYIYIATNSNVGTGTFSMTDSKPDYNGDGSPDILWQSIEGDLRLTLMSRTNVLQTFGLPTIVDSTWRVMGQADFDANGSVDLLLQSSSGLIAVYYMQGTNFLGYTYLNSGNPVDTAWHIAGLHDMDNDGQADILFQHSGGALWVWLMDGIIVENSYVLRNGATPGAAWRVVALADFNNDGQTDILFQHDSGFVSVWFMSGTKFIEGTNLLDGQAAASGWRILGVNDYNFDGQIDLLWENINGDLIVWLMTGITHDSGFYLLGVPPQSSWKVVGPK
ncbi:MAG: 3-carboxymuconate cyclase [Verrucomicrobiales bacterium]|nr:3-carboxymuconate cyclase [Verrucomicrobiales bacterium]